MRTISSISLALLALPVVISAPASANPEKSAGVATACLSRSGMLTKVKIGHKPLEPCAEDEKELKILAEDIPHMRERRFFVKVPASTDQFALLKFEGFHVLARCDVNPDSDELDAWLTVTDDQGQPLANVENTEHQYLLEYEDPAMAERWA
jgi:hypothetical protein